MTVRALLLAGLLCACSTSSPRVFYYDLSTRAIDSPRWSDVGPAVRLERFKAAPGIGGEQILMRRWDFRIDHYYYHRWLAPSSSLITELVGDAFATSGQFRRVDIDDFAAAADLIVSGRITRFEGVSGQEQTVARVTIVLTARRANGEVVLTEELVREIPVTEHSIAGLVRAFRDGIWAIARDVAPRIAQTHGAGAAEPEPPSEILPGPAR